MKRQLMRWDRKVRRYWKHYLLQSFLATLSVFSLLWLLHMQNLIVVASIGATAFIVFAMPEDITAKSRNVIGGHLVGFACGSLCALIPYAGSLSTVLVYSLAVGLSILIMVVIDTEHPPAAGTALGVAISGFSLHALASIVVSVTILSSIHHFFKARLKNLV